MSSRVTWSWLSAGGVALMLAALSCWFWIGRLDGGARPASRGLTVTISRQVEVEPGQATRVAVEFPESRAQPLPLSAKGEAALRRLKHALSLPVGTEREGALSSAACDLELEDAVTLLEIIPQGADRDAVVSGIMDAFVTHSPAEGALLFAALPAADRGHRLVNQLVNPWASSNPAEAAAWTAGLPLDGPREDATIAVVQSWITADARAAAAWLLSLPKNDMRDRVLMFSAQQLAERAPDLAVTLALGITQESLKARTLGVVSRN